MLSRVNTVMKLWWLSSLCCLYGFADLSALSVTFATHADFPELLLLNKDVAKEFFLPLFKSKAYRHSRLSQWPEGWLAQELAEDEDYFRQAIEHMQQKRLLIARTADGRLAGLLLYHFHDTAATLDLFIVRRDLRRQGVGKALVNMAIATAAQQHWLPVQRWIVWPLRFNNDKTLRFYRKVGFKPARKPRPEPRNRLGEPLSSTHCHYMLQLPCGGGRRGNRW